MSSKQAKVTFDQIEQHNMPPWPEWSDSYINACQWGRPIKHSMGVVASSPSMKTKIPFETDDSVFEDPAGVLDFPPDIQVHSWKHPHQLNPDTSYVVEQDPTPLALVTYNQHLLDYEIMRTIITSINCLERESFYRPFPIEFQSDQFEANGGAEWKPWHHVYALTLAGKGQTHNLQYNPYCKYIVRLFFLGKWRRIVVDDRLPVDEEGQILLPMSRPNNLWLPLLSKALLKIASLSWMPDSHCLDFSVIHCLTGWIPTLVPCKGCTMYHLWCVCCQLMATTEEVVKPPGCCKSQTRIPSPLEDTTGLSAVSSRAILAIIPPKDSPMLMSTLEQMVLIGNVRYNSDQPSPQWKQYRWNEWAFNKGIISEIPHSPVRSIQIYNPLVDCSASSGEISIPANNEVWVDFEDFAQNIRSLMVYYKPSYFKYSLRAWSDQELLLPAQVAEDVVLKPHKSTLMKGGGGDAKSIKTNATNPKKEKPEDSTDKASKPASTKDSKGKGKKGKGTEEDSKLKEEWPKNLKKSSFFYLSFDSMTMKELLVSISVYSPDRPTLAIIFVGRFEWHSPAVAPVTFRISSKGTTARFFVLEPGLRVFRVWHQFPAYYCFQLFSNTYFQTGSKMFIQNSLTFDSLSYKFYGREICSSFEQLLVAPQGGASHGGAFQNLMRSLDPVQLSSQLPWPQWFRIHSEVVETFEESLTEMLVESIHHQEDVYQTIQAFQLLFLNPVFGMKTLKVIKPETYKFILEQKELQRQKALRLEQELKEQLAQAAEIKGKKALKSDQSKKKPVETLSTKAETNTETPSIPAKTKSDGSKKDKSKPTPVTQGEQLKKLIPCKEKNLLINDQSQAILLVRKMMSKLSHLRDLYPFHSEDNIKLVYKDYIGEIHASDTWVVLVRCVFNIHSTEPVPCSVHIWSPVENLVLRLIDNETKQDVLPLGFVENNVVKICRKKEGYTICAYGLTDHARTVPWRIRSMGLKEGDCLHICKEEVESCTNTHTHPAEQYQQTVYGYYVPNKQNIIASCLMEVSSSVMVMLRLHLSHHHAVCRLTVTDEAGEVVCDSSSNGQVIVAILHLKGREGSVEEPSEESTFSPSESVASESGKPKPVVYRISATLLDKSWPLTPLQMKAMLHYKENLPAMLTSGPVSELKSVDRLSLTRTSLLRRRTNSVRTGSIRLSEHPKEISDKPSWSLNLVTDFQEEMPVTLRLDTSLYETMEELKKEWEKEGLDSHRGKSLRQEFLKQFEEESEEELSEDVVFKLKPKKLDKLTELYGRKVSDEWLREHREHRYSSRSHMSTMRSMTFTTLVSRQSLKSETEDRQTVATVSKKSLTEISQASASKISQKSESPEEKTDHTNVLVQQAGVHKALQNIREKTQDHIQQIFKETAQLREKIINEMKMAKDAELGIDKSKQDSKKGKKSKDESPVDKKGKKSKDVSPTGTKGKKGSAKDTKKPKGKGK